MRKKFSAGVWREGSWFVAQCFDVDVASQGRREDEALANLKEAVELHFEPPRATAPPKIRPLKAGDTQKGLHFRTLLLLRDAV